MKMLRFVAMLAFMALIRLLICINAKLELYTSSIIFHVAIQACSMLLPIQFNLLNLHRNVSAEVLF